MKKLESYYSNPWHVHRAMKGCFQSLQFVFVSEPIKCLEVLSLQIAP